MKLASRISLLGTETAFTVLQKARALEARGRHIIHLEIGEPDFKTPAHIVDAAKTALDQGWTHYGPTPGYEDFRAAIAANIGATRGIQASAENVCVVPGGKPILFFVLQALLDPGDECIYPNPGFPIYESMIRFSDAVPVAAPLVEENSFSFCLDRFERSLSPKTKLVILNSPANPTGGVMPRADVEEIARMILKTDAMVLSDEIYSGIYYGEPPFSIASVPGMAERTIILDGFSKAFAMTGWRLGYGVMPAELAQAVGKLMVNSNSCTASFTQRAGLAAITGDMAPTKAMVAEFQRRRDALIPMLNGLPGFRCRMPEGAFYAFPNVEGTGMDSGELAARLLEEAGVAVLSGESFGEYGKGFLRLSYANSLENLMEAVKRMRWFLEERVGAV